MRATGRNFLLLLAATVCFSAAPSWAQNAPKALFNPADAGADKFFTPTSEQVTVAKADPGVQVTIVPGKEGYPGLSLRLAEPADLSNYGHVEAKITNTGTKSLSISLRVDNAGRWQDNPWNTETITLKPGATGTVSTIFGFSYGKKPGYKLDPSKVVNFLLFTQKSDVEQSFRIETLQADGPKGEEPPVDPKSIRIEPKNGYIVGPGAELDAKQVAGSGGVKASIIDGSAGKTIKLEYPSGKASEVVTITPAAGKWSLKYFTDVRVTIKNEGKSPVSPKVQVASDPGPTDAIVGKEIAPGATQEILVPFAASVPWTGTPNSGDKKPDYKWVEGTGTKFTSDATSAIKIWANGTAATLSVVSVQAKVTTVELPDWVGKRPPVEGEWVKTLSEEFDGDKINEEVWNIYGPNYWDKKTHWSKDNIILKDGQGPLPLREKDRLPE